MQKSGMDEADLLKRLQVGEENIFEALYDQYFSALYLHAYNKLRDREVAKDIVHDLFVSLWEKRASIPINKSISSYLYVSIRNRTLDYLAKEKSKEKYLDSLIDFMEASPSATDHRVRKKMLEEQIDQVLDNLPPRLKEVFQLSRKHHLTHREISEKLNLSEQSVRSYVKDALKVFRTRFGSFLWTLLCVYFKIF